MPDLGCTVSTYSIYNVNEHQESTVLNQCETDGSGTPAIAAGSLNVEYCTGYTALSILSDPIHAPISTYHMDPDPRSASRQILAYLGPAGTYSHQVYLIPVFHIHRR